MIPVQYNFLSGLEENIYPISNNTEYIKDSSQEITTANYDTFPAEMTWHSSPQSYSTQSPLDVPYQLGENMADCFNIASPTPSFLHMAAPIKVELYYNQQTETFGNYPLIKQETIVTKEENPNYYAQNTNTTNADNKPIDSINSAKKPKETSNKVTPKEEPKKVHTCNYCNRSFARKYDVARHKRIHTGSKPYACPCCPRAFARSDARVRHFRAEIACQDGIDKLRRIRKTN
jgi:hypothetical protein